MPKDMGMEWTTPQEIQRSNPWELLNSSDRLSGVMGIKLELSGNTLVSPENFTSEHLSKIWSPDQYKVLSDIKNGSFSVEIKSNSDANFLMRFVFDQDNNTLSFTNNNMLLEDIHNVYDPKVDNIAACQQLSRFGQLLGLPPLDQTFQLEIQNHILIRTGEEAAAVERHMARMKLSETESLERMVLARKIYDEIIVLMIAEANPELANLSLDSNTFPDPEIRAKILKHSRMNTIEEISDILAKDPEYFFNPGNIEYLKDYLKNVAIGHNWFASDDDSTDKLSKHHDFLKVFKVSSVSSLSAVIVNPSSRKYKEVGTGWHQDRPTYLLPLKDFGELSLAFEGDIDDPSGIMDFRNEDDIDKYFDSVYQISDVAILQAIYDQEWEQRFEEFGRRPSGFGYNEVLVFSKVDFTQLTPNRIP